MAAKAGPPVVGDIKIILAEGPFFEAISTTNKKPAILRFFLLLRGFVREDGGTSLNNQGEDIELVFHSAADLWLIKFDPSQIDQIPINLVINARDALPDGGGITIESKNIIIEADYCWG